MSLQCHLGGQFFSVYTFAWLIYFAVHFQPIGSANNEIIALYTRIECQNMNPNILRSVTHRVDNETSSKLNIEIILKRNVEKPHAVLTLLNPVGRSMDRWREMQKLSIDLCNVLKMRKRKLLTMFTENIVKAAINLSCPFKKDTLYTFKDVHFRGGVISLFQPNSKYLAILDVYTGMQEHYLKINIYGILCRVSDKCK